MSSLLQCLRFSSVLASPVSSLLQCRRFSSVVASPVSSLLQCLRFSSVVDPTLFSDDCFKTTTVARDLAHSVVEANWEGLKVASATRRGICELIAVHIDHSAYE